MYCVYDIETLKGLFLYVSKNLSTGKISSFRIDRYKNDLYALVKHLREEYDVEYLVSYNGLSFDAQVMQFILDNFESWAYYSNSRIVRTIYQFAQDLIDDIKYGKWPPYRERQLWKKQVDLFRIHHFDNENRRTSLKWLEYSMDLPNIEEMPIDHRRDDLSGDEIELVVHYCINDVEATTRLYWITRGETELEEYAGKDKIQDRFDLMADFNLPPEAMNWSDVKIGSELNKRGYAREAGIALEAVYELRKKRRSNAGFTFGDCIPKYVQFKTPKLQAFLEGIRPIKVNLKKVKKKDEQEFPIEINGTVYKIKKGGIHSSEERRIVIPGAGELLVDADVGSQYPNSIVKRGLYPSHLGPKWLVNYRKTITLRLSYKGRSSQEHRSLVERRKCKGVADMLKLALNGGGFGRTNLPTDWQYDPLVHFSCTIGNQFEILMLIEELELNGIHVISANTDGIVSLFTKDLEDRYYQICHEWESKVGNSESGKLEYTYYKKLIQSSVNDYLAIKADGKVKRKGDFAISRELHANKSRRIIPIAVEQYFLNGMAVEETIRRHTNVFDFCVGVKASSDYHYEAAETKTGDREIYHRIIRYYISSSGKKLLKIKNPGSLKKGRPITQCEAGSWLSTIYNIVDERPISAMDINYQYYICKAKDLIATIENTRICKKGGKKEVVNPNQLSLF
jgi:hypothetical protein